MKSRSTLFVSALAAVSAVSLVGAAAVPAQADSHDAHQKTRHVLLLSVDGLHQQDLNWYVQNHPQSAMASLVRNGTSYTRAMTPIPSDSFPGLIAQVTGGNPATTGIYYDDTYNRELLPAGTTKCAGVAPGAEVAFTEGADKNPKALDAGQGLAGLPGSILSMTSAPQNLIDPAMLPVNPVTCAPVYPHQYLKVNTIFEVAKRAGLTTAWSDKHPAYEILNGPSGKGVDDLFTPEINSTTTAPFTGADWTKDNAATRQYDGFKVESVLNEMGGKDHSGRKAQAVPAIFGMNFQSVSTAQKLPTSDGLTGGYLTGGVVPAQLLSSALDFVDASIARLTAAIRHDGLAESTTIILSAKHGQSPTDPAALTRVSDGAIISALNAAWKLAHPSSADLVAFSTNDDIMQLWLSDHSRAAADFAKIFLSSYVAKGNKIDGTATSVVSSGLTQIYAGPRVARYFGAAVSDPRYPDILGIAQYGVVYTGGKSKIAEHGGASSADRNVPLVVSKLAAVTRRGDSVRTDGANSAEGHVVTTPVETTQIAPTILQLLGLNPNQLQAVRVEGTKVLPAW